MPDVNQIPIVIYHAGCFDGFCAAWICWRVFGSAEFMPYHYGTAPPDVTGRDVFIVDFSFKRDVLLDMKARAKSLVVLDHHATAMADLAGLEEFCVFDMNKSGGRLTWDYFATIESSRAASSTAMALGSNPSWLVDYTEDRDLWRHALPHSKAINAALRSYPMDFKVWSGLDKKKPTAFVSDGEAILRYQGKLVESHVRHAREFMVDEHKVLCANCTCADITSEVAHELAKGRPFGLCWFTNGSVGLGMEEVVFSARSESGGIDVSEIAKRYGGGGHKHSASWKVSGSLKAVGSLRAESVDLSVAPADVTEVPAGGPNLEPPHRVSVILNRNAGLVIVDFGRPTRWVSLTRGEALGLAGVLKSRAQAL